MTNKKPFTRPIAVADLKLAAQKASKILTVFLAGPYIERGWSDEDKLSKPSAALRRMDLLNSLEAKNNFEVVLGEHRGVIDIGRRNFRNYASPAITELDLVKTKCDAVIILPSSPGSFCELGTWVIYEEVCKKMLILADKRFSKDISYIRLGAYKTAADHGAIIKWVDYDSTDSVVRAAQRFMTEISDRVTARSILSV
ncbi:hypothetical protein [Methylorubrum extorquens]|uniref:hypothetical protein n=1 Tax=Methylorubrum extorquens TaxID=408 RepID=UPI00209CB162|nr:hypothetical protein [Methylorubrum extorquens]MCP1536896.1 hypothetical protein [Methylorubrum extorquens]